MDDDAYDLVAYPGFAQPQAFPDRLATVATLLGMTPAPPQQCRMLELGCGDGATLLGAAAGAPKSRFVGIDSSARAISMGRGLLDRLSWSNVELRQIDLTDAPDDLGGPFDYVVAHGLYAWVPPDVRERVMAVCARQLARPHGVAYVSYNACPGGHVRRLIGRMMRDHARRAGAREPAEQVRVGLELLDRVAAALPSDEPMAGVLRRERERLARLAPAQVFHDELGPHGRPVWFADFVEHAARHGLQYLAEAQLESVLGASADPNLAERVERLAPAEDAVTREQYGDYLRFRHFRQTLLCHASAALTRPPDPGRLRGMWLASPALAEPGEDDVRSSETVRRFRGPRGAVASTNRPPAKAALAALIAAAPDALRFEQLEASVKQSLGPAWRNDDAELERILLSLLGGGFVEMRVRRPHVVTEAAPRPVASPLARAQVEAGPFVTTLDGATVRFDDEPARALLRLLDGTRDRERILSEMPIDQPPEQLATALDVKLRELGRIGLLMG